MSLKVGGQAVIEGVMMRTPGSMAVAVRRADGRIEVRDEPWIGISSRWPFLRFLKWPFFRGAVVLGESMHNGMSALGWAADRAEHDQAALDAQASGAVDGAAAPNAKEAGGLAIAGTMMFSLALAFGLFIALPHGITLLGGKLLGIEALNGTTPLFHAVAGFFKLCILLGYLWGISRIEEIHRVFQYHGAEHKAIYAWEADEPLEVAFAQAHTRLHPRCGTSFLFIVIITSILVFTLVLGSVTLPIQNAALHQLALVALKLPLLFPIAGIAYEFQRLSARFPDSPFITPFVLPGLWLQRITTQEPDDAQVEVALVSLKAALAREAAAEAAGANVNMTRRESFVQTIKDVVYDDPRSTPQPVAAPAE